MRTCVGVGKTPLKAWNLRGMESNSWQWHLQTFFSSEYRSSCMCLFYKVYVVIMSLVAWKNNIAYCLLEIKFIYVDVNWWPRMDQGNKSVCICVLACWFVTWKLLMDDVKEILHVNVWVLAEWFPTIGRDEMR